MRSVQRRIKIQMYSNWDVRKAENILKNIIVSIIFCVKNYKRKIMNTSLGVSKDTFAY